MAAAAAGEAVRQLALSGSVGNRVLKCNHSWEEKLAPNQSVLLLIQHRSGVGEKGWERQVAEEEVGDWMGDGWRAGGCCQPGGQ